MVVVSLRDRYDARDAAQKRGGAGPAAPAEDVALTHSVENSLEGSDLAEEAGAPLPSGAVALAGQEEVSVPRADVDAGHAAPPGPLAPPTVVASAPARDASADAGEITAATTTMEDATAPERPTARAARDAGAAPDPFAPPSMSAGAGPFLTEAPYHSSSAFVSNPDAGAGRFMTEAPPWSASAFVSNPEAGAGPFTTERNVPAFGVRPFAVLWPYALAPRE